MTQPLRFWGGIESSVVRLNDEWRDQVAETGAWFKAGLHALPVDAAG